MVDFGTATTFDAINERGDYLGGAIAPGIEISVEALGLRGAKLPKIEMIRPRNVIGNESTPPDHIGAFGRDCISGHHRRQS